MKNIARPNIAGVFRVRCLSILLIAALCLANIQPAFAGFDSIASSGFSASVTIGEVKNAYPEKPDLYALAYPYIKYYLDRALDTTIQTDYSFNGFTRSFQRYNGGGTANCESLIFSGAAGYDQAILGRICLFNGITTILDTYVSFYNNISDAANPILKCSDGYTDGDGNALLYGPYRIARITNRGTSSDWWSNWDWSVDTGAAAVLIMYAAEAYDKTSTQDYRKFAALLGGYMLKLQDTDGGLRYGPRGMYHDSGPDFYWNLKSTEHNERALYAFEALFRMTQDSAYQQAADRIKTWLKGMYDFDAHLFHSSSSYENNVWVRSNFSYVATDVTALAPLSMIFDDTFFGATQGQRDAEVDAMFAAIETRTAFLDINDKPVFFKFSVSQTGSYGSVEISSQMALAYLRAAQIHHERGSSEIKAAQYLDKYNTLVNSLGGFFSVPGDDSASMIAPYASYLDKAVAGNVPTGTGFDTYNCEAALASGYFVFAKAGYIPYLYNGGNGIPDVGAVVMPPSGDSDYDGIPDDHDADPYDPYDAYEMDDDGFTGLEKYALSARGIDIFDSTMYVAFSASPSAGQIPLDVTFTVNAAGSDIVKYEWDFDGNGTYDRWQYASEGNTVRYKYTAAGAHNVRVRVTNKSGKIAVSSLTVNALKAPSAPSAQLSGDLLSYPVVNEFVIASTRALKGAGTASSGKEVVMYQWDVSGTGEYELSSAKSADATRRFDETISRMFTGALKVTDSQGLSDIAYLSVMSNATGWDNSNYRPVVYLDNNVVYGTASSSVALGGYGIPAAGNSYGYAKKLEWDFESDGIYDWSSSVENNAWTGFAGVTHKYGAPGVYRATLKAHTEANLSSYKTGVVIVEGGEPAIRAEALVSPDGGSFTGEIASGVIPVKARFSHLSSTADAVKFEWDFDGDKRIDYITTDPAETPIYNYVVPGYFVAMLRVTDSSGNIDTDYIPVFCAYPASYSSAIKAPKEGQVIAGNSVTLSVDVFPDDSGINSVIFQYSSNGGITWFDISPGHPVISYAVSWDTTARGNGTYYVRAIVNGVSSSDFKPMALTIDNSAAAPDVYENNDGTYVKSQVIDPWQSSSMVLLDGTRIDMPYGSVPGSSVTTLTSRQITIPGAGNTIDVTMTGLSQFLKDITITIPYPDDDDDGIIDGTNIDENTLVLKWYNENTGEWEMLYNSVVYPNENLISAQVNHLTIFGWGVLAGGAAAVSAGGGSSHGSNSVASYCFIATAAYGTPMSADVLTLREFRDNYLLTSRLGAAFVETYYRFSPPAARFICDKPVLRRLVRFILRPFVLFARAKNARYQSGR